MHFFGEQKGFLLISTCLLALHKIYAALQELFYGHADRD